MFLKNLFRKDFEPIFNAAFERAKILKNFEKSIFLKTDFIYRQEYRGGCNNEQERDLSTKEYYENIRNSDYVVCIRGTGNFSVRLYETLMMGKIPIFFNTDCILPFENEIDWKKHVVWIEWKDRKNCAQIVSEFHKKLTNEDFINLQLNCRKLWKETLSITICLTLLIVLYLKNMCGISGFINQSGKKIAEEKLFKMLQLQHHRGPDASGTYYDDFVGFAHNRLSLIDLSSNANQPFKGPKKYFSI